LRSIYLVILLTLTLSASAQQKPKNVGIIVGNLLTTDGKPAAYANIQLKLMTDSTSKRNAVTDKNGAFEFTDLPFGYYRLSASLVGYAVLNLDSIYLRAERYDFNLGDVKLKEGKDLLEE